MGVYRYTLRAETKIIGGNLIGRFGFAYKETGFPSPGQRRREALMERHADNARDKLPTLTLAILGDFKYAETEQTAVFDIGTTMSSFSDGRNPGPVVGYITKEGREYYYRAVDKAAAA